MDAFILVSTLRNERGKKIYSLHCLSGQAGMLFKTMILTRSHVSCPYQATIEDYRVKIIQQEEILAKITLHMRTDHTLASWVEKPSL
jgi:hypothetical protein